MDHRIVEVSRDDIHLSLVRGFLKLSHQGVEVGRVAVEDIGALIIRGYGASLSVNICTQLAEANVPVIICGTDQSPDCVIWPLEGHFAQGLIMQCQAEAGKPLQKRLWSQLVRAKIKAQAEVLGAFQRQNGALKALARKVLAGDSENIEAQAARRYWAELMGNNFKRSGHEGSVNGALNYGYTVLRAAAARSALSAGLHPSLSIHHQSRGQALRLADDLMEPFRPWVDYKVKQLQLENENFTITPEIKAHLTSVLQIDCASPYGASPLQTCLDRLAQSLVRVYQGEQKKLEISNSALPLFSGLPPGG